MTVCYRLMQSSTTLRTIKYLPVALESEWLNPTFRSNSLGKINKVLCKSCAITHGILVMLATSNASG